MHRPPSRTAVLVLLTAVPASLSALAGTVAAPAAEAEQRAGYAAIAGVGAPGAQVVVDQWIADVDRAGIPVTYSGSGAAAGVDRFSEGSTDFAVTDLPDPLLTEGPEDAAPGRASGFVPVVAGGTAFVHRLEVDGVQVRDLRLSGETLAGIFTGRITTWSDPAVVADNNGRALPDVPITPVVRADEAGITAVLTRWFDHEFPELWRSFAGRAGSMASYPSSEAVLARFGTSGVIGALRGPAGNGAIGYVEGSEARISGLPVAKVGNAAGWFTLPSPYGVAVGLSAATVDDDPASPGYGTADLDAVYTAPDPRSYPLSSYTYAVVPVGDGDPRLSTARRQTLVDFFQYAMCVGQTRAEPYGNAPLAAEALEPGLAQLRRIADADPAVDGSALTLARCANPNLDPDGHELAEQAPMPEPCDRLGAGPCGVGSGGGTGGPTHPARIRVGLRAPVVRGVHLVRPDRRYLLTVRTNLTSRPRYLPPVARSAGFRGPGEAMRPMPSAVRGIRAWRLSVQVRPGATTKKIGIRVGTTRIVPLLVRRAR